MTAKPKTYRVLNPLISVRVSRDPESPDYERFIEWREGDAMTEWPSHCDIKGLLDGGHIEPVKDETT